MSKSELKESIEVKRISQKLTRLISIVLISINSATLAQNVETLDSLSNLLNNKLAPSERVDALNELAYYNFDVNDSLANLYARTALSESRKSKYLKGEKYASTLIGLGLASAGKYHEAVHYFEGSDKIKVSEDRSIESYNHMLWGTLFAEQGLVDSSLFHYNLAIKLSDFEVKADRKSIYKNIARLMLDYWQNEKALIYLDSSKALDNNIDAYFKMELASQYALTYLNLLEFEKANENLKELCNLADENSDYYHKIECKLSQSRFNLFKGEYHDALLAALEALSLSTKYNYYQYVEVLIQLGETYLELSNLELSANYFYQALKLSNDAGLKHKIAIIYNNLAWIAKIQRKFNDAINYTIMAENVHRELKDFVGVSEAINVRGLTYALMKDFNKAEVEYKKAINIRKEINHPKGIAASMYNLADLYLDMDRNKEALELLYQVVEIEKILGNKPSLSMTYGLIARQLVRERRFEEALRFLKISEKEGENEQSPYIKQEIARSFVFFYREQGDYKQAYHYQREYEYLTQEIYDRESADKMAEYEALYKTQVREKEIALLNEKQRSQEDEIQLQQLQLVQKNTIIISSIAIIVLLGFIIWRNYRHNRKLMFLNIQLTNQKEEAVKANAAKSEFLANVSHELRTPLNGVIGFTDLLSKTTLNDAQKKYTQVVTQSASTLLSLIDDILDFSKLDAGKLQLSNDKVSLSGMLAQVTNMIQHQVDKKGLKMILSFDQEIPECVFADELRLKQILSNLVSNAVKFTHQGEIEIEVNKLDQNPDKLKLRFTVRDTGIGIEPENQKRIFEAFVQEDISTTKKFGGTGLGLTISNKLLQLMGSRLELKSEPGKGSIFYFDIIFSTTPLSNAR